MRKLIVMLWVVFLPITSILAQSNEDKQEVYEQLKEWAVVKLTIAYMEDFRQFTPEVKGEKGSEKEYKTYKFLTDNYQDYSNEINLERVSKLLVEGDWARTQEIVFDSYKTLDITSDFNFDQIQTYGYTQEMSKRRFNETITVLNNKYEELLEEKDIIEDKRDPKNKIEESELENYNIETINESPLEETSKKTSSFSFWFYGILGALLVALIIIFRLLSKNDKLKHRIDRSKKPSSDQGLFSPEAQELRGVVQERELSERKLNEEIHRLNLKIHKLNIEIESLKNGSNSVIEENNPNLLNEIPSQSIQLDVPKHKSSNLIYLSSPFQNLTFANEDASKDKTINSLYLVEFNEQMQTGELSVLVDTDLSKALNSPDAYLETACKYDNEYSNNVRAIKVTEKGEIKLEGDDWIVTKKVRIKFI